MSVNFRVWRPYLSPDVHLPISTFGSSRSQALAGFGIDSPDGASDTTAHRKEHGDDVDFFSAFTGRGTGAPPVDGSNSNSNISGGGFPSRGGVKGERDRVSSVDVADLLRATRLRGGARRASRPRVRDVLRLVCHECWAG